MIKNNLNNYIFSNYYVIVKLVLGDMMYNELNVVVKTDVRGYIIDTVRVRRIIKNKMNEIDAIIDGVKVYRATVRELTDPDASELTDQIDAISKEYGLKVDDVFTLKGCVESGMPLTLVDSTGNEIFTKPVTYIKVDLTE